MNGGLATVDEVVVQIDKAREILSSTRSFAQVKVIKDTAAAAAKFVQARNLGIAAAIDAQEIVLRAERKLGEMLRIQAKNEGGRPSPKTCSPEEQVIPSLKDQGITRKQSHCWQAVASVPAQRFEAYLTVCRDSNREPNRAGVLRVGGVSTARVNRPKLTRTPALQDLPNEVASNETTLTDALDVQIQKHGQIEVLRCLRTLTDNSTWLDFLHETGALERQELDNLKAERDQDPDYAELCRSTADNARRYGKTQARVITDFVLAGGELALVSLGLNYHSSMDCLKSNYRIRSLQCHPDRGGTHASMAQLNSDHTLVKGFFEEIARRVSQ